MPSLLSHLQVPAIEPEPSRSFLRWHNSRAAGDRIADLEFRRCWDVDMCPPMQRNGGRRAGGPRQDSSDQLATGRCVTPEVLPFELSHPGSQACRWLRSDGAGHSHQERCFLPSANESGPLLACLRFLALPGAVPQGGVGRDSHAGHRLLALPGDELAVPGSAAQQGDVVDHDGPSVGSMTTHASRPGDVGDGGPRAASRQVLAGLPPRRLAACRSRRRLRGAAGSAAFSVLGFGRGGRTHAVLRRRVRVLRRRGSGRRGVVR
jgi:hypothetical protein